MRELQVLETSRIMRCVRQELARGNSVHQLALTRRECDAFYGQKQIHQHWLLRMHLHAAGQPLPSVRSGTGSIGMHSAPPTSRTSLRRSGTGAQNHVSTYSSISEIRFIADGVALRHATPDRGRRVTQPIVRTCWQHDALPGPDKA